MRLIGTLSNENQAHRFTAYLKKQGIDANCEVAFDAQTGHLSYHFWIRDEDQIAKAASLLEKFQSTPSDPEFNISVPPPSPPRTGPNEAAIQREERASPKRINAPVTSFFLSLCIFVFLLNWYQEAKLLTSPHPSGNLLMTPVVEAFFFDLPPQIDELGKNLEEKSYSEELKEEEEALYKMSYWHGAYDWVLDTLRGTQTTQDVGPLFYKIRQGDFWRLFTPVLLHGGLLHILFNMIWLWVLGIPIEQRIGMIRTVLLTLLLGVGSNVCQYLMGGPFFLGYSGIVVGLAGFIWMREKIAPWEGYPLQRPSILFLLLFIGGMFAIQFISFGLQLFTNVSFSPNIANTGHISGGLLGMLLARLPFFSSRPK